jgi:hypothetical protein
VRPTRASRPLAIAALALALAAAGCGRGADKATVRTVSERFFAAIESGDGEQACAQLSPSTRAKLESEEQSPCREAITKAKLDAGSVEQVQVYGPNAQVELSNGEAAFLDEGRQGWRLSAAGCKPQGSQQPYDCEVES